MEDAVAENADGRPVGLWSYCCCHVGYTPVNEMHVCHFLDCLHINFLQNTSRIELLFNAGTDILASYAITNWLTTLVNTVDADVLSSSNCVVLPSCHVNLFPL
jgi:hypothetical protein